MKEKIKNYTIDILLIILGSSMMAIATNYLLLPNQLSSGGFAGIVTITYYLFKWPLGIVMLCLNLPFFVLCFIKNGKEFFIKTIIGSISLSIFLDLFKVYHAITTDRFLACVYGGIIMGIGLAIVLKADSSTGGTDLISNIIRAYKANISTSNIIVIIDVIIVGLNIIVFGDIEIGLYSGITIYIMGKMIDIIFEGIYFTKMIFIISKDNEEIAKQINKQIKRGVTGLYGKGIYTDENRMILLCAANRKDSINIKKIAKQIDKKAFIIISNAREVVGIGFKKE